MIDGPSVLEIGIAVACFAELRLAVGRLASRVKRLEQGITPPGLPAISKTAGRPGWRWLPCLLWGALVFSLCGCTTSTREQTGRVMSEEKAITKTTTVADTSIPGADGLVLAEKTTTTTYSEQVTKGKADSELHEENSIPLPDPIAVIAGGAKAAAHGSPLGGILAGGLGLLTTVLGAYAAHKSTQASAEKRRADWHEHDADVAYQKLDAKANP